MKIKAKNLALKILKALLMKFYYFFHRTFPLASLSVGLRQKQINQSITFNEHVTNVHAFNLYEYI